MTQHALVIGNSDGIGLATTRALLARGAMVTGISRRPAPIDHPQYEHIVQDVAEPAFRDILAGHLRHQPDIDLCVYSAGIGTDLDLENLASETRTFAVNVMGAVTATEIVLGHMIARDHGHFIGLSSTADVLWSAQVPAYTGSKAGISRYWEGLGLALRGRKVKITNVRFGFVDTKMAQAPFRPFLIDTDEAARFILAQVGKNRIRATKPHATAFLAWAAGFMARSPLSRLLPRV